MAVKRKKQTLTIYSDDLTTLKVAMPVEMDELGEAWLTPDQVEQLEAAHRTAALHLGGTNTMEPVRNLVMHSRVARRPVAIGEEASSQLVTLLTLGVQGAQIRV